MTDTATADTAPADAAPLPIGHSLPAVPTLLLGVSALWAAGSGRTALAIAAAGATLVTLQLGVLSPGYRRGVRTALRTLGTGAVAVIVAAAAIPLAALLLLPALLALVVAAVVRLLRSPVVTAAGTTGRVPATSSTSPGLPRLGAGGPPGSPPAGRRTAARAVVAVLVVEAIIGAGVGFVLWQRDRDDPDPPVAGVSGIDPLDTAALRDQPDAAETAAEMGRLTADKPYTPFTGFSLRDFEGRFVNVRQRVRTSYQPTLAPGIEPLDVWFFGGSAMFGFAMQRDDHTIASEVSRLAEDAGLPIRVRNYGTTAATNYSETVLLSLIVSARPQDRPDLVVFYDGPNDVSLQLLNRYGHAGPTGEPGDLGAFQVREAMAAAGLTPTADAPSRLVPEAGEQTNVQRIVGDIIRTYGQGVDVGRALGSWYGFEVVHVWQPDLFSKQQLDPGEIELLEPLGYDDFRFRAMASLERQVRALLPDGVVDLSGALDGTSGPVMSDSVHHNEVGARAVAEALFSQLEPRLAELTPFSG